MIFPSKNIRRCVVKVGSSLLLDDNGPRLDFIDSLVSQLSLLRKREIECVLITSGAIGCGAHILNRSTAKLTLPQSQACSAVGQSHLMNIYEKTCSKYDILTAQILLTAGDCHDRLRYLNAGHTLRTLLKENILPVVNQNDTVAVDEICFGDNDILGALVTHLVQADLFVVLTQTDGLQDYKTGTRVSCVEEINDQVYGLIRKEKSPLGRGGMLSKIKSAEILAYSGEPMVIVSGHMSNVLEKLFDGQDIGTFFLPRVSKMSSKRKWIAFAGRSLGHINIDVGAREALLERGKSLLSSGILDVSCDFKRGDIVSILCNGTCIARGLTNFCSKDLIKIKGLRTALIPSVLKVQSYNEVIHRNNLVIVNPCHEK